VSGPSFAWTLCCVFGGKFIGGALLKVFQDLLQFTGPIFLKYSNIFSIIVSLVFGKIASFLLSLIINFIKEKDQSNIVGYFYVVLMLACHSLQTLFLQHYFHRMFIVGARVRTACMNLIYKKVR
jgi:uncharacterized membrane protein